MKSFFKDFKGFILNLKFIIPLILSVAIGYGYIVGHFAIGIDDLARQRYITGELVAQGRVSSTIVSYLFGFTEYAPIWEDLLSVLFMIIASITAAVFLKRVTNDGIHEFVYTFFACFFATYPIINEIFLYGGSGLNMGIGYMLIFVSLILMEDFFRRKKWYTMVICTVILIFNISLYESFVFVYACAVCGVLLIKQLTSDGRFLRDSEEKNMLPFKNVAVKIMWYVIPLLAGFVLEYIMSNSVRLILGIEVNDTAASVIVFPPSIRNIITFSIYRFVFNGLWYLPITVLVISGIVLLVITVRSSVKCKRPVYLLYLAGMILSVMALPIMQNGDIRYRTSQALVIFCVFPLAIFLQRCLCNKSKVKKYVAVTLSLLLIFAQSLSLFKWFAVDYKQSEEDTKVLCLAGDELKENYDLSKPVIFTGEYTLSDNVLKHKFVDKNDIRYKALNSTVGNFAQSMSYGVPSDKYGFSIAQTDHMSVITWGVDAFGEVNTELLRIYSYLGYDFIQGSQEQFDEAKRVTSELRDSGELKVNGYTIISQDDYTLVAFG